MSLKHIFASSQKTDDLNLTLMRSLMLVTVLKFVSRVVPVVSSFIVAKSAMESISLAERALDPSHQIKRTILGNLVTIPFEWTFLGLRRIFVKVPVNEVIIDVFRAPDGSYIMKAGSGFTDAITNLAIKVLFGLSIAFCTYYSVKFIVWSIQNYLYKLDVENNSKLIDSSRGQKRVLKDNTKGSNKYDDFSSV